MSLVSPVHAEIVKGIIDGDTLVLRNGEHVRLIGIDAPELGRKGKPSQPFAKKAQQHLTALIKSAGYTVSLDHDKVRRDHYGRTLAHVHTKKHGNLSSVMLESGFATLLAFPPNVKCLNEYGQAQGKARAAQRGLWVSHLRSPISTKELNGSDNELAFVRGRVTRLRKSSRNFWLWLDETLLLKTTREEGAGAGFESFFQEVREGDYLSVLGDIYVYKGQRRMRLRVPQQIMD